MTYPHTDKFTERRRKKLHMINRVKIVQILLERRYPVYLYDKSPRDSLFRLRADRVIAYMNKIESEENNHE